MKTVVSCLFWPGCSVILLFALRFRRPDLHVGRRVDNQLRYLSRISAKADAGFPYPQVLAQFQVVLDHVGSLARALQIGVTVSGGEFRERFLERIT